MKEFEEFKKQHILETKERLKSLEDSLEELKSAKLQSNIPTAQQMENFSKKKKKHWTKILENREKLLSLEKTYETILELTKRELKANILAKSPADMVELTCQECGEQIFGMVCDLCGHNNYNSSNILKIAKKEIQHAEKLGAPTNAIKTTLKKQVVELHKREDEKKKKDEIEQFILDVIDKFVSCKECGKQIDSIICDDCGFDNDEHKKNMMIQGMDKVSEHYNISFIEAGLIFKKNIRKLVDEGKIHVKY